jgi:hypothetical protein
MNFNSFPPNEQLQSGLSFNSLCFAKQQVISDANDLLAKAAAALAQADFKPV